MPCMRTMIFVLYFMVLLFVSLKGFQGRDAWIFAGLFLVLGWIAEKVDEGREKKRKEWEDRVLCLLNEIKAK
jgi:hypothetical protein